MFQEVITEQEKSCLTVAKEVFKDLNNTRFVTIFRHSDDDPERPAR